MKHPDLMPLPGFNPKDGPKSPCLLEQGSPNRPLPQPDHAGQGNEFPTCLAEALDILVDRATRHGLAEVAHLLEVAALAARDAAALSADRPCQPERKHDDPPSAPV